MSKMFKKLRRRIIIITMAITTAVLILSGSLIIFLASTTRPEPKLRTDIIPADVDEFRKYDRQEIRDYINDDREEGNMRLLITLLCTGAVVEAVVFLMICYLSKKVVTPVKDSYDKQKIFIANASHELKTPLAVIQANVEALEVSRENRKWKDNIESEISHANKLVLDLLQLAKMDAGEISKAPSEKINLNQEVEKRIEMFKPRFSGNISLRKDSDAKVYLLPKQDILQVLDILLDNATKYGDKKVSVVLDKNELSVSNDGATIPKAETKKVFDRFYQSDKTREGSGLGLAIAKSICDQNGWSIHCKSIGRSTKFTVTFS